jgi:hypothetical protein
MIEAQPPTLPAFLEMAVPLEILRLRQEGGPTDADLERARTLVQPLLERGDVLLFGRGKPGEAGALAGRLANAIAVLSFAPGGVRVFGQHWIGDTGRAD